MSARFSLRFTAALLLISAGGIEAGALSGSSWTPTGCGAAPAEFKLDLSNPDAYNASVEGVNRYRQSARDYIDCLAREANADIQAITNSAKAAQQARLDTDQKIQDDVKAADKKFSQ